MPISSKVAKVASTFFGATVQPAHVIGETLRRATPDVHTLRAGSYFYSREYNGLLAAAQLTIVHYTDLIIVVNGPKITLLLNGPGFGWG